MSPGRSQSSVASVADAVDALLLAARGVTEVREYRLADLPRLADLAKDERVQARLSARFYLADARVGIVGRATADLKLTCQRCLGAAQIAIDDEFHVVLIDSEDEMNQLPDDQDAVIAVAGRFELSWLLEEQLLLALPLVPTHATTMECAQSKVASVAVAALADGEAPVAKTRETQRPFENLRDLLNTGPQKGPRKTATKTKQGPRSSSGKH